MTVHFVLLLNRQCKVRLAKWYTAYNQRERDKVVRELGSEVVSRGVGLPASAASAQCNFLDWREHRVVYKRYASLYFVFCVDRSDNELITLEVIHRFVFILDKYFGSVTELDLIYDFSRAFLVLDELLTAGEMLESSAAEILRTVDQQDELHKAELLDLASQAAKEAAPR